MDTTPQPPEPPKTPTPPPTTRKRKKRGRTGAPPPGKVIPLFDDPHKLIGTDLWGRYHIEKKLGEGGQAKVYLAFDKSLGAPCVIKVIAGGADEDRIAREVTAALRMQDVRRVARVFEHGMLPDDRTHYLAFRYFKGMTLSEKIDQGALPWREAVEIAVKIAAVMDEVHKAGVLHRDLKPANIILCDDGQIAVLDFGVAYVEGEVTLTRPGAGGFGTPPYIAPELMLGAAADTDDRVDVFSLGVILYRMIAGEVVIAPISNDDAPGGPGQAIQERKPVGELVQGLPELVVETITRAIRWKPDDRYVTMEDFHAALHACLHATEVEKAVSEVGSILEEGAKRHRRRTWMIAGIVVAALMVGGVAGFVLGRSHSGGAPAPKRAISPTLSAPAPPTPPARTELPTRAAPPAPGAMEAKGPPATTPHQPAQAPASRKFTPPPAWEGGGSRR